MHEFIPIQDIGKKINHIRNSDPKIKIVFTNGIFDLIHRGHVAYLEEAKALGTLLVVGINSDDSAARLKGIKRPLVNQDDRAYIISRLESVDIVSIFDENTPIVLIKEVKPDVLVKGGDYKISDIVGREFVESYGGQVCTIPFMKGKSTTNMIKQIKEKYKDS